jgi:hypothetical protein
MASNAEAVNLMFYNKLQGGNSIRLMELGPGHADQPIVANLITVESVSSMQYYALSYVWNFAKTW